MNQYKNVSLAISDVIKLTEDTQQNNSNIRRFEFLSESCNIKNKIDNLNFNVMGQLLAILYFFNIKDIFLEDISVVDNKVLIYSKENFNICIKNMIKTTAADIGKIIINNSVYRIGFINEIKEIHSKQIEQIKLGFEVFYNSVVNKKIEILDLLSSNVYAENMNLSKISNASHIDLERQLDIINMIFYRCNPYEEHENSIWKLLKESNSENNEIEILNLADKLIEKSIIGYYKGIIQITWIDLKNVEIVSVNYKSNIKRAELFTEIFKLTGKLYYKTIANQITVRCHE